MFTRDRLADVLDNWSSRRVRFPRLSLGAPSRTLSRTALHHLYRFCVHNKFSSFNGINVVFGVPMKGRVSLSLSAHDFELVDCYEFWRIIEEIDRFSNTCLIRPRRWTLSQAAMKGTWKDVDLYHHLKFKHQLILQWLSTDFRDVEWMLNRPILLSIGFEPLLRPQRSGTVAFVGEIGRSTNMETQQNSLPFMEFTKRNHNAPQFSVNARTWA